MKTRIIFTYNIILTIILASCSDNKVTFGPQRKLDLKVIENSEIKIEQYEISEITSIHEFVDLTNIRWNKVERIYEGNTESIDSIYIKKDTIVFTTKYDNPTIYDLAAIKFGYKIVVKKNKIHKYSK